MSSYLLSINKNEMLKGEKSIPFVSNYYERLRRDKENLPTRLLGGVLID